MCFLLRRERDSERWRDWGWKEGETVLERHACSLVWHRAFHLDTIRIRWGGPTSHTWSHTHILETYIFIMLPDDRISPVHTEHIFYIPHSTAFLFVSKCHLHATLRLAFFFKYKNAFCANGPIFNYFFPLFFLFYILWRKFKWFMVLACGKSHHHNARLLWVLARGLSCGC